VLHALGTPAERRQAAPATAGAEIGERLRRPAQTTRERRGRSRVREREPALLAPDDAAALVARERGGEAAHSEEHAAAGGERLAHRARERRRQRLASQDAARIGHADGGHGAAGAAARSMRRASQRHHVSTLGVAEVSTSASGSRRAPLQHHVARVDARGARGACAPLRARPRGEQAAGGERREQRRARSHRHPRSPFRERAPRTCTLVVFGAGVEPRDGAQLPEPRGPPRRGVQIGNQHDARSVRGADAFEQTTFASVAGEERRTLAAPRKALSGRARPPAFPGGGHQRRARRAERRQALRGDPSRELEACASESTGAAVDDGRQRLQSRVRALPNRHHEPECAARRAAARARAVRA
jgi:hypothetical protein